MNMQDRPRPAQQNRQEATTQKPEVTTEDTANRILSLPVEDKCANRPITFSYDGHGYFYSGDVEAHSDDKVDWLEARNICREYCMDLVSIETPSENDLIEELISGGTNCERGGHFGLMLEDMHNHNMHTNLIPSSALGLEMMMKKSRMGKSMMRKSMMKKSMRKFTPCSDDLAYIWTSGRLCNFKGCDRDDLQPVQVNGWFWSGSGVKMAPTNSTPPGWSYQPWSDTGHKTQFNNGLKVAQPDNAEFDINGSVEACMGILNDIYQDGIKWHDIACYHTKPYVCEDSDQLLDFVRASLRAKGSDLVIPEPPEELEVDP